MAIHKLPPDRYPAVQVLFHGAGDQHLYCSGVLSGKYTGEVYVDDIRQPRSAAIFSGPMWCFLAGDPDNAAFNRNLGDALIRKEIIAGDTWALLFHAPHTGWHTALETLISGRPAIPASRHVYFADHDHWNPPPPIAAGYALHPINETLPGLVDTDLPPEVKIVLDMRSQHAEPDGIGFGYVALEGLSLAAWAVVDRIVGTDGEIGLFTEEAYRRKGLGMAVSGAALAYGLGRGLQRIHWDVISYNRASIRMAEKHGLFLAEDYEQHLVVFNELSHLANLAWYCLDNGEYEKTLDVCQRLLTLEKGKCYGNFLSGAAWAGLDDQEKAFSHLHRAVDAGWDDPGEFENCEPLKKLRDRPEWEKLMQKVKQD